MLKHEILEQFYSKAVESILSEDYEIAPDCDNQAANKLDLHFLASSLRSEYYRLPHKALANPSICLDIVPPNEILGFIEKYNSELHGLAETSLVNLDPDEYIMKSATHCAYTGDSPFQDEEAKMMQKFDKYFIRLRLFQAISDLAAAYVSCRVYTKLNLDADKLKLMSLASSQLSSSYSSFLFYQKYIYTFSSNKAFVYKAQSASLASNSEAYKMAREIAEEAYQESEGKPKRYGIVAKDIQRAISADLDSLGINRTPTIQTIKGWIDDIVPELAKLRGRPKKVFDK